MHKAQSAKHKQNDVHTITHTLIEFSKKIARADDTSHRGGGGPRAAIDLSGGGVCPPQGLGLIMILGWAHCARGAGGGAVARMRCMVSWRPIDSDMHIEICFESIIILRLYVYLHSTLVTYTKRCQTHYDDGVCA